MNLKALKEKRARLIAELDEMVVALENEVRSLTDEEVTNFDTKKAEIRSIDETIKRVEDLRADAMGQTEELTEQRSDDEVEKRALENYLRGADLTVDEKRALQTTANSGALLPTTIHKTIMKKLAEQCPVLDKAKRFNTKGTLRLIKEDAIGEAGVKAENTAYDVTDPTFKTVELKAFKVATGVQITFEMLANNDIDLSGYLSELVIRRLSLALNKLFIAGTGSAQPQGLIKYDGDNKIEVASETPLAITHFIQLQTSVNPFYLNGAVWIVNRKTFQAMASLLDGMGRPYMTNDVINGKIVYRLLGLEVVVDENMQDHGNESNIPVVMANLAECYAVNMVQEITVKHMTEKGFAQGYEEFGAYVLADGKIVNDDAMAVIVVGS